MNSRRITIVRRLVQGIAFVVIVYGGFTLGPAMDHVRGEVVTESG